MSDVEDRYAKITDEAVDSLRRLIGVPITDTVEPWCYEATRDNIRHYAHGIGDDNPLWCDPRTPAGTAYGDVIAPPSFVFALNRILSGYVGGLPGIHAMWAGADLTWHRPIVAARAIRTDRPPRRISSSTTPASPGERSSRSTTSTSATIRARCCAAATRGASAPSGTRRARRARSTTRPRSRPATRYTEPTSREIHDLYEASHVRGAEPRDVDDVAVGDELPVMPKGPMTVTGFIAFAQGWGGLYIRANKLAYEQIKKHPGLGIPNASGIPDVPERVHWEDDLARDVGTPGAYDYGPERCSWLTQHLTDWVGDDGFLDRHSCQIRHHNVVGDWLRITGSVVAGRTTTG